jgi:hypothetical protein
VVAVKRAITRLRRPREQPTKAGGLRLSAAVAMVRTLQSSSPASTRPVSGRVGTAGVRGYQDAYLPSFMVRQKLKEVAERAQYESQRFDRIPIAHVCWPPHFKQQLFDGLVSQLPCADVIADEIRARSNTKPA